MPNDMLIIVPSRGRPNNITRMLDAWDKTDAIGEADLMIAIDADDQMYDVYADFDFEFSLVAGCYVFGTWRPMVHKLNTVAREYMSNQTYKYMGFFGDDHLPRTNGWAQTFKQRLDEIGTGIIYGDDLLQGVGLPTHWVMTSNIVRALGCMVPSNVEHLYCDNVIRDLGRGANCLIYEPNVVIEHMHPFAAKTKMDEGYIRVNSKEQNRKDWNSYNEWLRDKADKDITKVKGLM